MSVALARVKFGFGLAAAGVTAAMRGAVSGRVVSPTNGGARLCVSCGSSREAIQEIGSWRLSEVLEKV